MGVVCKKMCDRMYVRGCDRVSVLGYVKTCVFEDMIVRGAHL